MKKILILTVTLMIAFSSLIYAGGDQNCGIIGIGPTGTTAGAEDPNPTQTRAAEDY